MEKYKPTLKNCPNVIHINLDYLYHTTIILNDKSRQYWKETNIYQDIPSPPENEYHTDLKPPKWFTISRFCDYGSPWMGIDEVFLKYKVKTGKTLKLWDIREFHCYGMIDEEPENIDGYLSRGDCEEIFLYHPDQFVEEYEEIEFCQNKCADICRVDFKKTQNVKDIHPSTCQVLLNEAIIKIDEISS
jgi:hypothetical protein